MTQIRFVTSLIALALALVATPAFAEDARLDAARKEGKGLLKKAHMLRWRPRPHAQRTGSTPRVRPSGAASHLDLFEQPASVSAS